MPSSIETDQRRHYCVVLPDKLEYEQAFFDALLLLTEWINWEHEKSHKASDVASYLRQIILPQFTHHFNCEGDPSVTCCGDDLNVNILENEGNSYLNGLSLTFQDDPANLDPDAPNNTFDSKSGDSAPVISDRQTALCEACRQFVVATCAGIKAYRDSRSSLLFETAAAFGIVGIFFPPAEFVALILGLAGGFVAVNDAMLVDQAMQHGVACCMYESLKTVTLGNRAFSSSLDGCTSWDSVDITLMSQAIAPLLASQGVYESFLKALGQAYRDVLAGLVGDCGCDSTCATYSAGGAGWTITHGTPSTVGGVDLISSSSTQGTEVKYVIPGGTLHKINHVKWIDSDTAFNIQNVYIDFYDGNTLVQRVTFVEHYHNSNWVNAAEGPFGANIASVDKIIIINSFDQQDGTFSMHDIEICWE